MVRSTAPHNLILAGSSIALLKLVQKLVERNGADEWLEPVAEQLSPSTFVVDIPRIVHGASSTPEYQKLTWTQVIDFIKEELERVDLRIWFAVLLIFTLGPVIWSLTERKGSNEVCVPSSRSVSTQTDQEPEAERKDPVTIRYYRYEPAERALLQFGRSKSESVLFNYVPTDFDEVELDDYEGVVAGCTLPCTEAEQATEKEPVEGRRDPFKDESAPNVPKTSSEDTIGESNSTHQASLGRSLGSLPSLRDGSSERAHSAQSQTFLPIQLSPRKTSIVEVQVNPEQAYSQPFSY